MKKRKTIGRNKRTKRKKTRKHVYRGGVGDICPICHEELTQYKLVMTFEGMKPDPNTPIGNIYTHPACGNKFHMDCIKQWCIGGERNDECPCPICRAPINHNDLDYTLEEKCQRKYNKLLKEHTELKEEYEELEEEYEEFHNEGVKKYNDLVQRYNANDKGLRLHYSKLVEEFNANDNMRVEEFNNLAQRKRDREQEYIQQYETLRLQYNDLVNRCRTTTTYYY